MRFLIRLLIALTLSISVGQSGLAAQGSVASRTIAIIGVDVLPMTATERLHNQTVIIAGDRILTVGPAARTRIPAGARRVEGRGMTLMPGLVDMHVHLAPEPGRPGDAAQRALAVMLAHGVTTARGMAGSPTNLIVRDALEAGTIAGPRLYASSPALSLNTVASPDAARSAVRSAREAGYDFIKSHALTDVAVWQAVQDEAKAQRLASAGHVTNEIGLDRAMAAGQQVEHLDGALLALLAANAPERAVEFAQIPPPAVIEAVSRATDAQIRRLAARVVAKRSYQVPTLSLFEKLLSLEAPTEALATQPDMRYVPDAALKAWSAQREQLRQAGFTAAHAAMFRDLRRRIVREYARAGVPLMAGSDTAQSFHIWGPGLLDEIEALTAAGLTPIAALRSATIVPRDYFRAMPNGGSAKGWKAEFGTVEPGARADLILLASDPSRDLKALRSLRMVFAGGRAFDRASLDAMLAQAAFDAKNAGTRPVAGFEGGKQVYVMRHLQARDGPDPSLDETGAAGATRLATQLTESGIKAIFVTDTRRSRETAAPLAARLGVSPAVYDPARPDQLVAAANAVTGNVLVLGHSNTAPDLVARFGGTPPAALGSGDFGTIWRIDAGSPVTKLFKVGARAPAMLGSCSVAGLSPAARCGVIRVPENRATPGGRSIDLHFGVVPAAAKATHEPVVMLPGGPGLGGVQSGPGIEQMFGSMHQSRDILLIDQRGTGSSNPLKCPAGPTSNLLEQLSGPADKLVLECRDKLAKVADLGRYHTREAVVDMEEVRAALGYQKLDLFGMSYGTRLALDYLRLYPARVGETVIRSAALTAMLLPYWTPRDAQRSFAVLAGYCRAQADCAARHPDLEADLRSIVAQLERGPVSVTYRNPASGKEVAGQIDRDGFGTLLFFLLYIPELYVHVPPLIEQAKAGNFAPVVQAVAPLMDGLDDQIASGLRWSVICDEDVRRIDRAKVAAATRGTFMGSGPVDADIKACAAWPRAAVPADYLAPVTSSAPVMIISGAVDPVAGPAWGEDTRRTLSNSLHLEVDGASHLPPFPGCTLALATSFMEGTPLKALDTSCAAKAKRPKLKVGR